METVIVIMLKNQKNGFFEKEFASIPIIENEDLILNIFSIKNEQNIEVYIKLTTERDVLDWEYDAIYDYYNSEVFQEDLARFVSFSEVEGEYNPTWEMVISYTSDECLQSDIYDILNIHRKELNSVYECIKTKEGDYYEK